MSVGKKKVVSQYGLGATLSDKDCTVRVADSGGLWFCIEDLCKWLGEDIVNGRTEELNISDEYIKHFSSQTIGGYNQRLYMHQSALYKVLCDFPTMHPGDFEIGANCYTALMLSASDFCYSPDCGRPAYIHGLAEMSEKIKRGADAVKTEEEGE